jgi:LacI family transcriptional regulator
MSITAKELAKKLQLSESAISLALNNKPGVSTRTRKKVLEAAREYGYDFSRIQDTAVAAGPKGTIYFVSYRKSGAIVSDSPFFSQILTGVDLECKNQNYFLNINILYEDDNIEAMLSDWKSAGVKGILLLGTEMYENDLTPFINSKIPFVLVDNYFKNLNIDCVLINNVNGAFSATNYLIQKTKEQPGYLHSSYSINNFELRSEGFYKALRENGMSASRSVVHRLTPSQEGAYTDMNELIEAREPIASCYFADNDQIAIGAIRAFRDNGYLVPNDISIIGFDDIPMCPYVEPPLTTIHVPTEYVGKVSVRRLCELISDPDTCPIKMEVATSLIKRKSVMPKTVRYGFPGN